jgi:hypothetical protein
MSAPSLKPDQPSRPYPSGLAVRAARGVRDVVAEDAVRWDGSGRRGDPEVGDDEDLAVARAESSDIGPLERGRGGGVRRALWRAVVRIIRCCHGVNGAVPGSPVQAASPVRLRCW